MIIEIITKVPKYGVVWVLATRKLKMRRRFDISTGEDFVIVYGEETI
jgi:hypothetical protein